MALMPADGGISEIFDNVSWPHIRLCQKEGPGELVINDLADPTQEGVGLGKILAVGALAFEQVRNRVQPKPIDSEAKPESQDVDHFFLDGGIVKVQVRLMREESVPVELTAIRVVSPVRWLGVYENNSCIAIARVIVAPHVI